MTIPLDVTHFYNKIREEKISLTLALTYFSIKAANDIDAFRYRYMDGKVVLFDKIDTRFSFIKKGEHLFRIFSAPLTDTLEEYIEVAKIAMETQKGLVPEEKSCDFIQSAPNPWYDYTSIAHTASGTEEDSIPLVSWGKITEKDGKYMMPYTLKSHHSFVDGYYIDKFFKIFNEYIQNY